MIEDDSLLLLLKESGLPPEVIRDNLPALRRFCTEMRAREVEFWGKYFVSSAKHYRQQAKQIAG